MDNLNTGQQLNNKNTTEGNWTKAIRKCKLFVLMIKVQTSKDSYIQRFLRELNRCRTNPIEYALIVEKHLSYIEDNVDQGGKHSAFYSREGLPKIALKTGLDAFRQTIEKLKTLKPMKKLEFKFDLQIPILEDPAIWEDKIFLRESLKKIKSDNKANNISYKNLAFHYDIGSPFSDSSFILQLVDDSAFNGSRSKNLLNPNFTYIGINSQKVKNKHCGYFLFASN